jgi:autotransporter-associated beta strand protein
VNLAAGTRSIQVDSAVEIAGVISDGAGGAGALTKTGAATLTLSGANTYGGTTIITDGTLAVNATYVGGGNFTVWEAGTLAGTGVINANVTINGTVAPGDGGTGALTINGDIDLKGTYQCQLDGNNIDQLNVSGELDLTACSLQLTGLGGGFTEPVYRIVSYGTLRGTFFAVINLPEGYSVDYRYDDGTSSDNIALVANPVLDPFETWAQTTSGLSGPDAVFDADANRDGFNNGLAYFLGAPHALADASSLAPSGTLNGSNFEFTFSRLDEAAYLPFAVEYSRDLQGWTAAADGVDGVVIAIDDGFAPGTVQITVHIPISLASEGPIFMRLSVSGS